MLHVFNGISVNCNFVHPVVLNNERVQDCRSEVKCLFYTYKLVAACFGRNKPTSGSTKYEKYLEGLIQLLNVSNRNEIFLYVEGILLSIV